MSTVAILIALAKGLRKYFFSEQNQIIAEIPNPKLALWAVSITQKDVAKQQVFLQTHLALSC